MSNRSPNANYRLRLAWQMHDRTLAIQMANDRPTPAGVPDPFPKADRLAMAFANSLKGGTALPTLHRYMRQLTNDVKDAFRMYETLRSRPIPLEPSDEFPNEPEPEPEPNENDRFPPSGIEPGNPPIEPGPAQFADRDQEAPETGTSVGDHAVGAMVSSELHGSEGLAPAQPVSSSTARPARVSAPASPGESPWFSKASAFTAPPAAKRSRTQWPASGSPSVTRNFAAGMNGAVRPDHSPQTLVLRYLETDSSIHHNSLEQPENPLGKDGLFREGPEGSNPIEYRRSSR